MWNFCISELYKDIRERSCSPTSSRRRPSEKAAHGSSTTLGTQSFKTPSKEASYLVRIPLKQRTTSRALHPRSKSRCQITGLNALEASPRRDLRCRNGACAGGTFQVLPEPQRLRHLLRHDSCRKRHLVGGNFQRHARNELGHTNARGSLFTLWQAKRHGYHVLSMRRKTKRLYRRLGKKSSSHTEITSPKKKLPFGHSAERDASGNISHIVLSQTDGIRTGSTGPASKPKENQGETFVLWDDIFVNDEESNDRHFGAVQRSSMPENLDKPQR